MYFADLGLDKELLQMIKPNRKKKHGSSVGQPYKDKTSDEERTLREWEEQLCRFLKYKKIEKEKDLS